MTPALLCQNPGVTSRCIRSLRGSKNTRSARVRRQDLNPNPQIKSPRACGSHGSGSVLNWEPELQPELQPLRGSQRVGHMRWGGHCRGERRGRIPPQFQTWREATTSMRQPGSNSERFSGPEQCTPAAACRTFTAHSGPPGHVAGAGRWGAHTENTSSARLGQAKLAEGYWLSVLENR